MLNLTNYNTKLAEFTHSPQKLRRSFLRWGVAAPLAEKFFGFW